LRILDLSGGIAGPLGVLLLAEHGADVIQVEPPGGAPGRSWPSAPVYGRSRRSVTVDLSGAEGRELFRSLCRSTDVVVEAFATGTMAELGLSYDELAGECPRLVYCSVPAWPSGTRYQDRPGYEALVHARSGQHWEITSFRRGPVFLQSPVASLAAAFLVPTGILSALQARERTGRGQHVEVSLFQGVMALTTQIWNWTDQGQFLLPKTQPPGVHQASIYECADGGWIHASTTAGVTPSRSEASVLGIDEVTMEQRMQMTPDQLATYEETRKAAFLRRDRDELVEEFHQAGHGAEAIVAPHERFDHPQLRATGSVVEVDDPEIGPTTQLGNVIFLDRTPGRVRGARPLAGAHNDEVFGDLGYGPDELDRFRHNGVI
jgi:crotonobetainyl-CoA:carnitine CoA-transferase CaiB-like acyl-CoA transferase